MGSDEFDALSFEKRLAALKDTQESIQSLSSWCLAKRAHHKKIVASWLSALKRAPRVEQRLTLFYLANDVIQHSKRKNLEFVASWGTTLQKATPLVRDDKIKQKILRIFRIWEERQIYNDEFLTDLTGLLTVNAGKQTDVDSNDFQAIQLINKIKQCTVLETDTDQQLKSIHDSRVPLKDVANLRKLLKDRRDTEDAMKDLDDGISRLESCVRALQKELVARAALCRLLQKAQSHYSSQRGEVKVVANAYKNFGNRVRILKRKLDETYEGLPSSPVPSPPMPDAVPSPGPDEDIDLPAQDSSNSNNLDTSFLKNMEQNLASRGFGTFIGNADFSFSFESEKSRKSHIDEGKRIEVISNRPVNNDLSSILTTLNKPPPSTGEATYKPILNPPPLPPLLPGLDLLNSNNTVDNVKPKNFYGTAVPPSSDEQMAPWNNSWDMQGLPLDTPESPPIEHLPTPPPPPIIPVPPPSVDVDHRRLLAPPPNMPPALMKVDDIDHRRLPPLPAPHPPQSQNESARNSKVDVDHRNLIPLTVGNVPPPPAPPMVPWGGNNSHLDQDYRSNNEAFSTSVPPPLPLMSIPPPMRRMTSHIDNIESIDMEMSDEENHDNNEDDYNRHIRLDSSMARLHGHPPPPLMHSAPPPPQYRDKSSIGNDRNFSDNISSPEKRHPNDKSAQQQQQRTNLVCINSGENVDEDNGNRDVFSDFPSNAMNPLNPNQGGLPRQESNDSMEDWERDEEDLHDPWQKRAGFTNPARPSFPGRSRPPMYNQRPPPNHGYRRPPPLLSTPPFVGDEPPSPRFNPIGRGSKGFRRPRGGVHHRGGGPRGGGGGGNGSFW